MSRMLSYRGRSLKITKAGWLFILLALAVGFAAINSGSNLLHAIFGCQMGIIIASGALSEAMVQRARVRRRLLAPIHAGTVGPLQVELENGNARAPIVSITIEDDERRDRVGASAPVFTLVVPAGARRSMQSTVTMDRRGSHRLPPAVVATAFPFGLFIKRREIDDAGEVLVYPPIHPVDIRAPERHRQGEGESSGARARAGEFYGLEEFRSGMEKRRIHWPATARLGRPVVQDFEAHGEEERMLTLETGVIGESGFESRVEEVASHAIALLRGARIATGIVCDGSVVVAPGVGPSQERRVLDFLATVGIERDQEGTSQ
jgi:uncharacterized protein (DUF58 family)